MPNESLIEQLNPLSIKLQALGRANTTEAQSVAFSALSDTLLKLSLKVRSLNNSSSPKELQEFFTELARYAIACHADENSRRPFNVEAQEVEDPFTNDIPLADKIGNLKLEPLIKDSRAVQSWLQGAADGVMRPPTLEVADFCSRRAGTTFYAVCRRLIASDAKQHPEVREVGAVYRNTIQRGFRGQYYKDDSEHQRAREDFLGRLEELCADSITSSMKTVPLATESIRARTTPPVRTIGPLRSRLESQSDIVLLRIPNGVTFYLDGAGVILGPQSEGTSAIVVFGKNSEADLRIGREIGREEHDPIVEAARAIRLPRLLFGDLLLNYRTAELCFYENRQAARFTSTEALSGGDESQLWEPLASGPSELGFKRGEPAYVTFYLSPGEAPRVGLLSASYAWPSELRDRVGQDNQAVFGRVNALAERTPEGDMRPLYYLPQAKEEASGTDSSLGIEGSHAYIEMALQHRDKGGWWFFLPIAVSHWMTADLQRMLNQMVHADTTDKEPPLRQLELREWIHLGFRLCKGLEAMHIANCIHGDVRPANVMRRHGTIIGGFDLIDIGMGFFASDQRREQVRAIGNSRISPFYAPERMEVTEFEDVDVVSIFAEGNTYFISLQYKPTTTSEPIPLTSGPSEAASQGIKRADTAARFFHKLKRGDRVAVRDFVFEVGEVFDDKVEIVSASELFMGRVVVPIELAALASSFPVIPANRIRVLWDWGQASDIYGLGTTLLYCFFMRGVWALRTDKGVSGSNLSYEGQDLNQVFSSLVGTLRNESFLDSFLGFIHNPDGDSDSIEPEDGVSPLIDSAFPNADALFSMSPELAAAVGGQAESTGRTFRRLKSVVERTWWLESSFAAVYYGANSSPAVFTLLIYFTLLCVWRKDELADIKWDRLGPKLEAVKFDPFCASRDRILGSEAPAAARRAAAVLEKFDKLILPQARVNQCEPMVTKLGNINQLPTFAQIASLRTHLELSRRSANSILEASRDVSYYRIWKFREVRKTIMTAARKLLESAREFGPERTKDKM